MPTAATPDRKDWFPLSCRAAAPVLIAEPVSACTVTKGSEAFVFLFMVVSFSNAETFLLISASARTIWAPTADFSVMPAPAATVVTWEVSSAVTFTSPVSFEEAVVISVLRISARTVSFPPPSSVPSSLSVNATPAPNATAAPFRDTSASPAMVVLVVLSRALTCKAPT